MGYAGQSFQIAFDSSALNGNKNIDKIPPNGLLIARNVNLHEGGISTRGGTSKDNSTAVSGAPRIMGLYYFRLKNGNDFKVFAGNDGKVYRNSTTTIRTGGSTSNKYSFETFENNLYIVDGATRPQRWNGAAASTSSMTTVSSDWSGSDWPDQIIKHGYGASERAWAKGVPTFREGVYYSVNGDGDDFGSAGSGKISIETSDGFGVVGLVEFGDTLMAFGKNRAYLIDDTSTSTSNWGYVAAQWTGGVANHRLIVKTDNDVYCMTEDGEIYSVTAAQSYGDYRKASLVRPSHMDRWIQDNVRLSFIDDFNATYDPVTRSIKWFVVRNGETQVDTALVYFIDRPPEIAWTVHDNQDYNSGYSASCSALIRVGTGDYEVWTGDYSGFVWKLEQSNANDDGNGYYNGVKTPNNAFDNPRISKHFRSGRIVTEPKGSYSVNVRYWVDGVEQTSTTVSLAGTGSVFGTGQFGTAVFGGEDLIDSSYELGVVGKRLQREYYLNTANQEFYLSSDILDFKPLGVLP